MATETCKQRWVENKEDRVADIRKLWKAEQAGDEDGVPDLGNLNEYGLDWSYVEAHTFPKQREGYWRWQISWGGPSDEFRFYTDQRGNLGRVTYVFMDWFDGHERKLVGSDEALLQELYENYLPHENPEGS